MVLTQGFSWRRRQGIYWGSSIWAGGAVPRLSQSCWQEASVPPHVGLSKEQLTTGQRAPPEQESRETDRQKPVFYNLISEVTSDIIISAILYTWYLVTGGDYTKVWIQGLLETSQGCLCAGSTRALEEHLSHQLQNWKLANGLPRWRSDKCQLGCPWSQTTQLLLVSLSLHPKCSWLWRPFPRILLPWENMYSHLQTEGNCCIPMYF